MTSCASIWSYRSRWTRCPSCTCSRSPNARYELVDQVLAVTKQAHVEKMGFVGNEAYANF